ncbi:hypothetical protein [Hyalangium sp.]|uniref:hypothetical protein n=1 Tax=Hyalangium sp. TaxID=2028555 RepID=UPI002D3B5947|nr:hypothetical protein [Hyalangium sp.]HYH98631.1 hypothetical protein [Hyalangium sp.]
MRLPAYILLPIVGAVVLVVTVLGSWLWPAPTVSLPSVPPPVLPAPVAAEAPPSPMPRPVARPSSSKPVQPVKEPPSPVAMPAEPVQPADAVPSRPPDAPRGSQITDLSAEQRSEIKSKFFSIKDRSAELAERGAAELVRQREEARARGDQEEFQRLDQIIRARQDRMNMLRQRRTELEPEEQAGPPLQ